MLLRLLYLVGVTPPTVLYLFFENFTGFLVMVWLRYNPQIFSSPEPKAPRCAYSIPVTPASVVRPSVRHPSTFSNIFSSETTWLIELKFHMETP